MNEFTLNEIMIKNFKIFNQHTEFSISPITFLTGTNNSGKTTLIKSLLLLASASLSSKLDKLNFGGEVLELGSFDTCLSYDSKDNYIDFKLLFGKRQLLFPNNIELISKKVLLTLRYKSQFEDGKLVLLNIWGIDEAKGKAFPVVIATILDNFNDDDKSVVVNIKHFLKTISSTIAVFNEKLPKEQTIPLGKLDGKNLSLAVDYGNPKVDDSNFPKKFHSLNTNIVDKHLLKELFEPINDVDFENVYLTLNEYLLDYLSSFTLTKEWRQKYLPSTDVYLKEMSDLIWIYCNPFISSIEEERIGSINFSREIIDISKLPEENIKLEFADFKKNVDTISKIDDVFIKDILKDDFFDFYSNFFGDYVESKYSVIVESIRIEHLGIFKSSKARLYFDSDRRTALGKHLSQFSHLEFTEDMKIFASKWLRMFDIGEDLLFERIAGTATQVFILKGDRKIELADLGYGSSQFVSLLISILIISIKKNSKSGFLFAIEEPETNLHPKLQSLLADFFVDANKKFNIKFIIETHSEYLIRKLQYLTAKKKIKPEDSVIYYFHAPDNIPKGEKQVKEIRIMDDGSLTDDFGPGFFDEATNIKFDLLRLKNTKNN